MKIAIVDDERKAQEIIEKYIQEWAGEYKELVEFFRYDSSESFLFSWETEKDYSLLVLDIEMKEINGMDLARRIRLDDENIPIMFITGYDEYIQYGYDVSAIQYLIKPVNKDRLFAALDKLSKANVEVQEHSLLVNTTTDTRRIMENDIVFFEADGHGSILYFTDTVLRLRDSLGTLEKQLDGVDTFIKCHRAYLVNLRFISAIQNTDIVLDNGKRIPISRNRMKSVQQEFLKYYRKRE